MIADLGHLPRHRQLELLSALKDEHVEDDGSLGRVELLGELAGELRRWTGASPGGLAVVLRRRLQEAAQDLGLLSTVFFSDLPGGLSSLDILSDRRLAIGAVDFAFNEAEVAYDWGENRIGENRIAEVVGRRLLAQGPGGERTLRAAARMHAAAEGRTMTERELADQLRLLRAGDAGALGLSLDDAEDPVVALVVGEYLVREVALSWPMFKAEPDPERSFEALPDAVGPVAEVLAAFLAGWRREEPGTGGGADPTSTSPTTRARRTREARAIAALGLCAALNLGREPAFEFETDPEVITSAAMNNLLVRDAG